MELRFNLSPCSIRFCLVNAIKQFLPSSRGIGSFWVMKFIWREFTAHLTTNTLQEKAPQFCVEKITTLKILEAGHFMNIDV